MPELPPKDDYSKQQAMLLAWLCLQQPQFEGRTVLVKAKWLMGMGFSRADAAFALGSTDQSLRVMLSADAKRSSS